MRGTWTKFILAVKVTLKLYVGIVCIGVSPPPLASKKPPPSFLPSPPLKSANCPSPLFRQSPPLYWFSVNPPPPPKSQIFHWTPEILKFFILNNIFYLLKVTKSLSKISQFEFLVMTWKNIFAYKLFLSLKIWLEAQPPPPPSPLQKGEVCMHTMHQPCGWVRNNVGSA